MNLEYPLHFFRNEKVYKPEYNLSGYSLEGQKNSLKRFADREEMEIVGIYEDAGKSGKSIESIIL